MPVKKIKAGILPRNTGVRNEAMHALIKNLGIAKASIFIRDNLSQDSDYLDMKKKLFAGKKVDDICAEIKRNQ